jgi:nucleotide-binding universal stress UspA family protein
MYKNLLVPVDGSELTERAMTESIAIARALGAGITGFYAAVSSLAPGMMSEGFQYSKSLQTRQDAQATAHGNELMARFAQLASAAGVPFHGHSTLNVGVEQAILEAAEQQKCDLIVMATHNRSALGELIWGSHTKSLISHTKLPVLVLH